MNRTGRSPDFPSCNLALRRWLTGPFHGVAGLRARMRLAAFAVAGSGSRPSRSRISPTIASPPGAGHSRASATWIRTRGSGSSANRWRSRSMGMESEGEGALVSDLRRKSLKTRSTARQRTGSGAVRAIRSRSSRRWRTSCWLLIQAKLRALQRRSLSLPAGSNGAAHTGSWLRWSRIQRSILESSRSAS